ncbi:hypothetical protein GGI43DRAFT_400233 [Trichoderma evansii]
MYKSAAAQSSLEISSRNFLLVPSIRSKRERKKERIPETHSRYCYSTDLIHSSGSKLLILPQSINMPRQGFLFEPISEDEEVEQGDFRYVTPSEADGLIPTASERPQCSIYHTFPMPNIVEVASQASTLAPQPRYGDPFEDNNIIFPRSYASLPPLDEYSPPSSPPASPSSTSSFYTAPTSSSASIHDHRSPIEFIKEQTQKRLQQTDLSNNFFIKWGIVTTNMYGGVIPSDSEYSVPPFALPSYDGQVRLRFIGKAFNMSLATLTGDIEKFLSRNLFIITCLVFKIVPNPNLIFDDDDGFCCGVDVDSPGGRKHNKALLCAIQQLEWTDPDIIEAANLSMTDEVGSLAVLSKAKESHTLPSVSRKMDEMVREDPQLMDLDVQKLHGKAVKQMRENRRHSLLRNVVMPEDVVV